jgi:F-type H+-transporting ATPase subunit b
MTPRAVLRLLVVLLVFAVAAPAGAQGHPPAPVAPAAGGGDAHAPAQEGTHAAEEHHDEGILPTVARLFNFAILAGVLVYFLRQPLAGYLQTRSAQIRQDLTTAAEIRRAAEAQLEQIQGQLAALPAELDALRQRGREDIAAEEARIAQAASSERARLLEQTRREIDMRLRVARRELTEHAAQLAVQVAEQRIRRTITADDQIRLVDRYAAQLREAR